MRIRDFLILVQERLEPLLPPELRSFQARIRFTLLQVYFDHPSIHYEVWPQKKTGRIEIGLHFEGEGEKNYRWAAVLAERMPEVQAALGPAMELEEWTPTWTRLHQTLPMGTLDEGQARRGGAGRLAALIQTMEPILEECRPLLGQAPCAEARPRRPVGGPATPACAAAVGRSRPLPLAGRPRPWRPSSRPARPLPGAPPSGPPAWRGAPSPPWPGPGRRSPACGGARRR